MRATDVPAIRALQLFCDMSEHRFDALIRGAYVQVFPPGVELIREGDATDFLHILIDGSVELFAEWNGRETVMSTVRPVSTFILAATMRDARYLMSARTLAKSRIVLVPSTDVRHAFDADSVFARAVVAELATCYRSVIRYTKDLKLRSSVERLANYILRLHSRSDGASVFELPMEKRKLASLLGMTPENLSRAIKTLQPYGVEIDGAQVTLVNLPDLVKFSKPNTLIDGPDT